MGDEQPGRKAPHLRLVPADANTAPPAPTWPGATRGGSRFVLDSGFALCGACGACLTGRHDASERLYVCSSPRGGCGAVRVPAEPFETQVAARVLAVLAAPSTWQRLVELGAADDRAPVTLEGLAHWWAAAGLPERQVTIGLLLDHVRVAATPGEEPGMVGTERLNFVWAAVP